MTQSDEKTSSTTAALWAHHLTIRLLAHVGVEITHEQNERFWDALSEVADGKLTVTSSPADMLRPFPNAPLELRDRLWARVNEVVRRDREVAITIRRDFQALSRVSPNA